MMWSTTLLLRIAGTKKSRLPLCFLPFLLVCAVSSDCPAGNSDFGVMNNGTIGFSISARNGTCFCGGSYATSSTFQGNASGLTGLAQQPEFATLLAQVERLTQNQLPVGSLTPFAGNSVPAGWLACDGSLVTIAAYPALFAVIATTFGGDGAANFAVPDLQGRSPIGAGSAPGRSNYTVGETGGSESQTLQTAHLPPHSHTFHLSTAQANILTPQAGVYMATAKPAGPGAANQIYSADGTTLVAAAPPVVGVTGGGEPVDVRPPFVAVKYIIKAV